MMIVSVVLLSSVYIVSTSAFTSPTGVCGRHRVRSGSHSTRSSSAVLFANLEALEDMGFPRGLRECLVENTLRVAKRFWIVDNSGSMSIDDGNRLIVQSEQATTTAACTRWKEVQDAVIFHAGLAGALQAPTDFILLNSGFGGGKVRVQKEGDVAKARSFITKAQPTGVTPLTKRVHEIQREIEGMKLAEGQQVALILATDGLPTDESGYGGNEANMAFGRALQELNRFPIHIVVRLCTNDEQVVNFYNHLDGKLELTMDVLDDYHSEAAEVRVQNPWLSYGLPLHRAREFGCTSTRLLDLLDERKLTLDEVRDMVSLIHGQAITDGLVDPQTDRAAFRKTIELLNNEKTWNPSTKTLAGWIDPTKVPR